MTNDKLKELNLLEKKICNKKKCLSMFEKYEPYVCVQGYGKVCDLTPIEAQMIKTRLQMELNELEKEFEAL